MVAPATTGRRLGPEAGRGRPAGRPGRALQPRTKADGDGRGATATGEGDGRRARATGDGRDGGSSGSGVTDVRRAGRGADRAAGAARIGRGGPKVRRPAFHGLDSVGHCQRAISCDPCRCSWNASRLCPFSVRCRIPVALMAKKRHQIATRYILCTGKDGPRPIEASS